MPRSTAQAVTASGGFEGFGAIREQLESGNLSVPDPEQVCDRRADLDSTGPPTTLVVGYDQHRIPEIPCFLEVELVTTLEGTEPVAEPLAHSVLPLERAPFEEHVAGNHQLHVVGVVAHRARKVAFVRSVEVTAHRFDVCCRHLTQ